MTVKLGVIADDFTGATDIAGFMVQNGWKVVQLLNEPDENTPVPQDVDAIVISLKSRSCPVDEAVSASTNACKWLKQKRIVSKFSLNIAQRLIQPKKAILAPLQMH